MPFVENHIENCADKWTQLNVFMIFAYNESEWHNKTISYEMKILKILVLFYVLPAMRHCWRLSTMRLVTIS